LKKLALLETTVRDAPAGIALAAGRHHITNFDADSARDAAPRGSLLSLDDSFLDD